jgi:bifunctional non-homologous end joining protein LigD
MGLQRYRAQRNFERTAEPSGKKARPSGRLETKLAFVIQKHNATRLHYDFRLEMDGVLKSWAVPKGIPTKRGERHLAVEVEDHPLEYGSFEGAIPPGNYGAGTVMLWDRGTYTVSGDAPSTSHAAGKLHLWLKGKKLKGEWTLVRIRHPREEDKPQWLLFKTGEDVPGITSRADDRSALTGRSMKQIASENEKEWKSNRASSRSPEGGFAGRLKTLAKTRAESRLQTSAQKLPRLPKDLSKLPAGQPVFVEPMKATLGRTLPEGSEWLYEIKFDGIRALALKEGSKVELLSRTRNALTQTYKVIAEEIERLPVQEAVIDGEIVALDESGRSSFQLLQAYQQPGGQKLPLLFYAFDLLQLEGRDLKGLPLITRKTILEKLLPPELPRLRNSGGIDASTEAVVSAMKARGLEGLVAKLKDSKYQPGRRSKSWIKHKWSLEQEFVVGGYTAPKGARNYFGALIVGHYDGARLICAGKVGTGFDERRLKELHQQFQRLRQKDCPFVNLPAKTGSAAGIKRSQMRQCTWVEPKLVCQIRFTEWTRDGMLRQPSFLGLREDKPPREVVRET